MIPWKLVDSASIPETGRTLNLYQRDLEFSIRMGGREVMNSRTHGSEDALAELACARIKERPRPRILIGGLGLGFTTAAALRCLGPRGRVVVAELVPAVVRWIRGPLAHLAGEPLRDPRVTVQEGDVFQVLQAQRRAYDAILLDVDNSPADLISKGNDRLYDRAGLEVIRGALRPGGVLAVWSAGPDQAYVRNLERAGFTVEEVGVRSRGTLGGRRHTIWLATIRIRQAAGPFGPRRKKQGDRRKVPV